MVSGRPGQGEGCLVTFLQDGIDSTNGSAGREQGGPVGILTDNGVASVRMTQTTQAGFFDKMAVIG